MTVTATTLDPLLPRLKSIDKHIASGQLPKAVKELNAAVKIAPEDPRIYLLGARMAEAAGNPKGAQEAARKAVQVAPNWPVAVTEFAYLLARQNQFKEAIHFAERAVQLDGNNPDVLQRVIDIAHRAQNFELAMAWLQRAAAIAPHSVQVKRLVARDYRLMGKHDRAMTAYNELIEASPVDAEALLGRVQSAQAMGDRAQALQDCEALLALAPGNEEVLFRRELARGNTPLHQPIGLVRALYDGYADLYDQHMVADLKYKLPREVARMIQERHSGRAYNVLDLGCGTGLLGVCLGRIEGALVGVDISAKMIEKAVPHNVYDRIHNVDLLDALQATPESLYEVITALDVFVYVGDLAEAIPNAFRILKDGGQLIFSCERALDDEADLVFRDSQRYAHKASHIESVCRAAGFEQVSIEAVPLRLENNVPVEGYLVVAQKPGGAPEVSH